MFWFWFWLSATLIMIVLDAVFLAAALRLLKRKLWRVLISVFICGQMAALFSSIGRPVGHVPTALFVEVMLWHFFGVAFGLAILITLRGARSRAWQRMARWKPARQGQPLAPSQVESGLSRRNFIGACAAFAPPLFSIGLTSAALAQLSHFRVRRFTLSMPTLPRALDGTTIAHVSDMHVGELTTSRSLKQLVETTNSLRADLVMMTGDLIDRRLSDLSEAMACLEAMDSRYGTWMIEGNHDLIEDGGEFERRVKASGFQFLLNQSAVTHVHGYPIQFFGLRWMETQVGQRQRLTGFQVRELMKQRQAEAFPILLAHHPHAFDAAAECGVPLTLSGHTHGGQIMFDNKIGFGPSFFRYWSGLYTKPNSQLIVSNGVGSWFPIRINAPAEVVHITLRCA